MHYYPTSVEDALAMHLIIFPAALIAESFVCEFAAARTKTINKTANIFTAISEQVTADSLFCIFVHLSLVSIPIRKEYLAISDFDIV